MDKLKEIEFHDSSLLSLELNLENNNLILLVELESGVNSLELHFSSVNYFYIDPLDNFKDIQIYSASFKQENNIIVANFLLLNGFGGKSYNLIFHYLDCVINMP